MLEQFLWALFEGAVFVLPLTLFIAALMLLPMGLLFFISFLKRGLLALIISTVIMIFVTWRQAQISGDPLLQFVGQWLGVLLVFALLAGFLAIYARKELMGLRNARKRAQN